MINKGSIPEKDLKDINDSFKTNKNAQVITKDAFGNLVSRGSVTSNPRSYVISDFRGRTLKHCKSVIPENGKQITIGNKGDKYENIDPELRKMVTWFESDFE